jgi:hypothetical protein
LHIFFFIFCAKGRIFVIYYIISIARNDGGDLCPHFEKSAWLLSAFCLSAPKKRANSSRRASARRTAHSMPNSAQNKKSKHFLIFEEKS